MQPASVPNLSRRALERLGRDADSGGVADAISDAAAVLAKARTATQPPERPRAGTIPDRALTIVLLVLTALILVKARITIHVYLDAGVLVALLIAWITRRDHQ
jgi:hypothetical protein